ncbi:DUF4857 domain-containing protein [Desulfobaculum bizertense]|uniref:DUF4857 domain-containing protein n=1 Tax=Desulfobaculum bizertense TaxID=376490 RepID=UPI001F31DE58|nr:DUF4857 domain-containing protein [Desulfobaculum bizertense]UIJ38350.1 DUF4857 domain-containing protein [Desulfobaculum bizertense]
MVNLSRLCTLLLTVAVLASALPSLYSRATTVKSAAPVLFYSPIKDMFLMQRSSEKGMERYTETGEHLKYKDYCRALPFMFHGNLAKWGEFHAEVDGTPVDTTIARRELQFVRILPRDVYTPEPPLQMLFEAEPDVAHLEYPSDMFRYSSDGVEFIQTADNTVLPQKSAEFSTALHKAGVTFPIQKTGSNPTNQKPFDWGNFFVDAKGTLFHLMMIHGKAVCTNTGQRFEKAVQQILVMENERKEFYGLVVTTDAVFAIMCNDYRLQKLPLEQYDPKRDSVMLVTTPLHRIVQQRRDAEILAFAMNTQWKQVHNYTLEFSSAQKERWTQIGACIFPFRIETTSGLSRFVHLRITDAFSSPILSLLGCVLALVLYVPFHKRRFASLPGPADCLLVFITGIYGLLALLLWGPLQQKTHSTTQQSSRSEHA